MEKLSYVTGINEIFIFKVSSTYGKGIPEPEWSSIQKTYYEQNKSYYWTNWKSVAEP